MTDQAFTHAEFQRFADRLCALLRGDVVPPDDVVTLQSEDRAEDGTVVRLFNLVDGRTGVQKDDGPIRLAD